MYAIAIVVENGIIPGLDTICVVRDMDTISPIVADIVTNEIVVIGIVHRDPPGAVEQVVVSYGVVEAITGIAFDVDTVPSCVGHCVVLDGVPISKV